MLELEPSSTLLANLIYDSIFFFDTSKNSSWLKLQRYQRTTGRGHDPGSHRREELFVTDFTFFHDSTDVCLPGSETRKAAT